MGVDGGGQLGGDIGVFEAEAEDSHGDHEAALEAGVHDDRGSEEDEAEEAEGDQADEGAGPDVGGVVVHGLPDGAAEDGADQAADDGDSPLHEGPGEDAGDGQADQTTGHGIFAVAVSHHHANVSADEHGIKQHQALEHGPSIEEVDNSQDHNQDSGSRAHALAPLKQILPHGEMINRRTIKGKSNRGFARFRGGFGDEVDHKILSFLPALSAKNR